MPQLVAILHSFVGAAAVLVGFATTLDHTQSRSTGVEARIHEVEIFVGVFVGAVTFTGSVVAFGKLQGVIGSKPLLLPGRHVLNLARGRSPASCSACSSSAPTATRAADGRCSSTTAARVAARHSPGDGDRRRRHAGRGLDAQQLFGLGRGGGRLHARRTIC